MANEVIKEYIWDSDSQTWIERQVVTHDELVVEGNEVTIQGIPMARKGYIVDAMLVASEWSENIYRLTVQGVTEDSIQEILPPLALTRSQLEMLQRADLQDGGQSVDTIILKAFGDVPTMDIPIRVIIRGGNAIDTISLLSEVGISEWDYNMLENKPTLQSVEISGNKSFADFGMTRLTNSDIETLLK